MSDNTQKAYFDFANFEAFEEVESVTMFNGLTLTEGSDRDINEFFSVGLLDEMMI